MIRFDRLERDSDRMLDAWRQGTPFPLLIIDDFTDVGPLSQLIIELPDPEHAAMHKSRDYVFAKNKYEKSRFSELGPRSAELYEDLVSERFRRWLSRVCGRQVWIDKDFHGGGLHQGGPGSFLDMHVDFNVHPLHPTWMRDLNILLYLNKEWQPKYGGELKLKNRHTARSRIVEPFFNRCVIMETRDYTMHGYDPIAFPEGEYRRSIACYAYSQVSGKLKERSTVWYPEAGGWLKRRAGGLWPLIVRLKGRVIGSGTANNR